MASALLREQTGETAEASPQLAATTRTTSTAQAEWAARPLTARLGILKEFRHRLATETQAIIDRTPPQLNRPPSDTLAAEVLPLLAAGKFLEHNAPRILRAKALGRPGLPLWLRGIESEVHRVPFGRILIIGPSNYPLLLPGVQALQALAAGNSAVWKPGSGGAPVARLFLAAMQAVGLPAGLLHVTDDTVEAAHAAIDHGADKIFFTGSLAAGRAVLRSAAETITPCVVELSGCDAVIVLPSADLQRIAAALAFGMRLNGSATCMAPRRILLVDADPARKQAFLAHLSAALNRIDGIELPSSVRAQLIDLLHDATRSGAHLHGELARSQRPLLLTEVTPEMAIAQADIFAPILSLIDISGPTALRAAMAACPFALTAAIFGAERAALALGESLDVGTLLINDLIVPTADPRVPFGGRRSSGFGVTRGAEGLLEMTAVKVVSIRHGKATPHFDPPRPAHATLFHGLIAATHAKPWRTRLAGLRQLITGAKNSKD